MLRVDGIRGTMISYSLAGRVRMLLAGRALVLEKTRCQKLIHVCHEFDAASPRVAQSVTSCQVPRTDYSCPVYIYILYTYIYTYAYVFLLVVFFAAQTVTCVEKSVSSWASCCRVENPLCRRFLICTLFRLQKRIVSPSRARELSLTLPRHWFYCG